jgi:para-aminobenzoate synthetase/4-amino-4-deoxychorismate lyase
MKARQEHKSLDFQSLSPPFVLLEDARSGRESARLFRRPRAVLCARAPDEVVPALEAAERALQSGHHVAGYFSYELGYLLERRLKSLLWPHRAVPLLWLGVFDACETIGAGESEHIFASGRSAYAGPLALEWNEADYARRFSRLHALIAAGDLYQANLTFRAHFAFAGDPGALYRALRGHARAGHCAYVADGARQILSLSPELFFELSADGAIRAKPMKGTAARGEDAAADARAREALAASQKDRAENLMIVDLLRNDLSRIAEIGSVGVEKLFDVETYPTVHQLVSTVTARTRGQTRVTDMIRALFPCGSVTGAPKIRAMEVIRDLEASPRGIYCGAIGAFSPDGSAAFNVAIRTLTIAGNRGELGIGGGVVYDSDSAREYEECLLKARYYEAARVALQLIETLRWSPAEGFVRLEKHLARMERSSAVFGIAFDRVSIVRAMEDAVSRADGPTRVRVTLGDDGAVAATAAPLAPAPAQPWTCAIAPERVDSGDLFLFHKTSRRTLYDAALAHADSDEVLFMNERGEITEGSRTNIFAQIDGALVTPPVACGLLDGCLRRELVDEGRCKEAILTPGDLQRADALYIGNSLRGLIPAIFFSPAQSVGAV